MQKDPELINVLNRLADILEAQEQMGGSSAAAQIIIAIVPLLGVVMGVSAIFFFLLWRYRINKELIKAGQFERRTTRNFRVFSLLLGTVSACIGLPMTVLFWAVEGVSLMMLGGLMPLAAGIGLILFVYLSRERMIGTE